MAAQQLPPGAPPEEVTTRCTTGLVRAESAVTAVVEPVLRRRGITGAGFNVLMILEGAGEALCPRQISERRLVSRGTITGVLDSLERQGLAVRLPHPDDGRSLLVELTARGKALIDEVLPEVRAAEQRALAPLGPEDRAALAGILERLEPPR